MNYEKLYKDALKKVSELYRDYNNVSNMIDVKEELETIFPELAESEEEKNIKDLIDELKCSLRAANCQNDACRGGHEKRIALLEWAIAWLEKQGDKCLVNFDEAEQEKYDFVSGQFIECRKSFNEFKEDNSYWFEYVGNDTYIGRSDNILNKKFHITPRQLYCLFTQQHFHFPKENNMNEETNAPTGYGKYVDECLNEASKHFFSEGEDKYSVADLFYAGVRCGKSWIEKQGNKDTQVILPTFTFDDILALQCCMETTKKVQNDKDLYEKLNDLHGKVYDAYHLEKQGEKKSVDMVEPKFKVGDWITDGQLTCKVLSVASKSYELHLYNNDYRHFETDVQGVDKHYHLWTIKDAKDGDVLKYKGCTFIFKKTEPSDIVTNIKNPLTVLGYCGINHIGFEKTNGWGDTANCKYHPATKEQRDALEKAMADAGYTFDFEKKELNKIEDEEYNGEDYGIDSLWHAKNILEKTLGTVEGYQSDDGLLEHKCAISAVKKLDEQKSAEWSEEDEKRIDRICNFVWKNRKGDTDEIYQQEQDVNWLKSLKDRVQPQLQPTWSEEDEKMVNRLIGVLDGTNEEDYHEGWEDIFLPWLKKYKEEISGLLDQIKVL